MSADPTRVNGCESPSGGYTLLSPCYQIIVVLYPPRLLDYTGAFAVHVFAYFHMYLKFF